MVKRRALTVLIILIMSSPVTVLAKADPFARGANVTIGSENEWQISGLTATRSGSSSDDYYHLFYDRKQLRLRITSDPEDSNATARVYQKLAVEDVRVDGKRLPLFKWCLANQQKHSRFLQQGLKVKQEVCRNRGAEGVFSMRLNAATLETLKNGRTLSFKIKPFRSSMTVKFDISDFLKMTARLSGKLRSVPATTNSDKVITVEICMAKPPKGFARIKSVEYACKNSAAKDQAMARVAVLVAKERKRKNAEAAKKKAAADARAVEQAALAEASISKRVVNADITSKMLAVCKKKWAAGEHRCYCEKFIKHAPMGIESDPACTVQ